MFRALSLWVDRLLGVPEGWGPIVVLLAFVVLMQLVNLAISLHKAGWLQWFGQLLKG